MTYKKSKEEILQELNTDPEIGLTEEQVEDIRKQQGYNVLHEKKRESLIIRFLVQFKDPLIIVLLIAAAISIVVDPEEWIESLIILIVVIFNAVLGIAQELNAEKSLEALKEMSAPHATVLRNQERKSIDSKDVVVGDIILLEAGDFIPSDGRLIEVHNLQVDESVLTGESVPVNKKDLVIEAEDVALGDQKNMVFASTVCTYGRGKMVVTTVGMENVIGKIAGMLMEDDKEKTPLQIKLSQISKMIGFMCFVICVVVFYMEYQSGVHWLEAFKTSVALAVAAIPEGLATVVTIVLALGVTRMVKSNAIIRHLPAVETLGSASIVCSDKTGTLTQNKMTVVSVYQEDTGIQDFNQDEKFRETLKYFTLCTDGEIHFEDGKIKHLGDPTETALVEASYHLGDKKEQLYRQYDRKEEIAFDSTRKMMTVFYNTPEGVISVTKGAPDVVIARCQGSYEKALAANETMANKALRVLAVAIRKWEKIPQELTTEQVESEMTFLGLVGMIDPPREEAKQAIAEAKKGGIRTIMITGDHITTAQAIAKQLGILEKGHQAITGLELEKMTEDELESRGELISVYARVAPEHKVRIVKMWQKKGHVVAMTGDGVNDSPALKAADIGCAMGITGTDVSKGVADMILTDDNFATIIKAVKEGRTIYNNIKKDVQFLLSSNIGEVFTIFMASLLSLVGLSLGIPLLPIHLLWVNLITDSLPAFALGMEPAEEGIMEQKPRPKKESFFANRLGWTIFWQGIMIGMLTLISYIIGNRISHELGMSMAFMTLSMAQLFHSFNMKSSKTIFSKSLFNNKYLWGSFVVGVLLQFTIMYTPGLNSIFSLIPLPSEMLVVALAISFCPILIVEVVKQFSK